jgi:AcrR family transcriptional regulator
LAARAKLAKRTDAGVTSDGRRLRSEASREAIVQAMLDLVTEGEVEPSAEQVANRAGVGLRTVFRHFENMESLYQQLNELMREYARPVVMRPFTAASWKGKIEEIIDRRVSIFERILPLRIAADAHRRRSPYLAAQSELFVREQRAVLEAILPAGEPFLLETLDLLLSVDTWRRLRRDQKLSRPRARAVLERLVHDALAAAKD